MISKKYFSLLIIALLCAETTQARRYKKRICGTNKQACLNDPTCQCYCSRVCNFRDKMDDDKPVYVPNDPNGKYCYCKQWDLDAFDSLCKEQE
jgi:hypothetical protein